MRVELDDLTLQIRLARWEKVLGLMRDIVVRRSEISEVEVVQDGVRAAMRTGLKAGLRLPWVIYVARTIPRLDRAFVVRRGMPALGFSVSGARVLRRVLVSSPDAEELARRLRTGT